ncbi:MAG: serine/threonine protein kinase [Candidatus Eremiobacteraeota bacterium]|nr:serine/threonine protein kinase [Candidatus Eremiobacteraeota bacterium]
MNTEPMENNSNHAEPSEKLPSGFILREKYVIDEFLGEGGLAYNYLAHATAAPGEKVVVKQTKRVQELDGRFSEDRFQMEREFRLLYSLDFSSIPMVYDYFEIENVLYLVREYRDGVTMDELIKIGLTNPAIENLSWQIMDVLEYLHEKGIVYRDLKPANVLIDTSGKVFFFDFGTARFHKEGKKGDTIALGTPGYASPEQYGISQTTPASDIYSFGALLYYIMTGENPENNPIGFAVPENIRSKISDPLLSSFLLKCLEFDPKKRFQSIHSIRLIFFASKVQNIYEEKKIEKKWKKTFRASRILLILLVYVFIFTITNNTFKFISVMPEKINELAHNEHYYYKLAKEHFSLGKYAMALYYTNCSIVENPKFEKAHTLKSAIFFQLEDPYELDRTINEINAICNRMQGDDRVFVAMKESLLSRYKLMEEEKKRKQWKIEKNRSRRIKR